MSLTPLRRSGKLVTVARHCSVSPVTFNGWRTVTLCGCCVSVSLTSKLTKVTADQMDLDANGLIKWSVIRPPTLADISCEG